MKNFFLNRQIERIEREANDDFLQILSFGAHCYPTKELHELLGKLDREAQSFTYYRRLLFLAGSTTTLWIALYFLSRNLNFRPGLFLAIAMLFISVMAFAGGSAFINRKFRSVRNAHQVEKIIIEELERRRKDASIF